MTQRTGPAERRLAAFDLHRASFCSFLCKRESRAMFAEPAIGSLGPCFRGDERLGVGSAHALSSTPAACKFRPRGCRWRWDD